MSGDGGSRAENLRREWVWAPGCAPGAGPDAQGERDRGAGTFSLMNYNILADCHFQDAWYPYCPEGHRKMADRHCQLMAEVSHHDPDIVCMQEVGSEYFAQQLNAAMFSLGYLGTFMNKIMEIQEGGATFYKRERFQMVEEQGVTFNQLVTKACKDAQLSAPDEEKLRKYTYQSHIVLLTKLQDIITKQTVSIGNTHLLFDDYKNIDITTLQAGLAIDALIRFAGGTDQPHILCGDFNQEPNMPGYWLLHDGKLDHDAQQYIRQWPIQFGDQTKSLVDVLPDRFRHNSTLQSSYKAIMGQEGPFSYMEDILGKEWSPDTKLPERNEYSLPTKKHPCKTYVNDPATCGQRLYLAALDYQWFSSGSLCCYGVLEMVDEAEVAPFHACPNEVFPSDHLSLCSVYAFKDGMQSTST